MRLDHVGLSVADLDAARDWYCSAFSLTVELESRVDAIELDIAMLMGTDGVRVELLHRPDTGSREGKPADPASAALRAGFGHIAFNVIALEQTHARLISAGAREVMAPQQSPEPDVRMSFLADPEGNLVELLERPR